MTSVPERRRGTAPSELGPIDELLLGLIEAGCQYFRDHPEARSELRSSASEDLVVDLLERLREGER